MAEAKKEELTKEQKLDALIKNLNSQFGIGTIITKDNQPKVETLRSGSFSLDGALGGGWARSRVIEIMGNESSGKTTLALQAIARVQSLGGICAFIDAEHALDFSYAQKLGVNTDSLLITQPFCGEESLEIVDILIASGVIDLIVVDSVAALVPRAELEGDMGDSHVGLQARLMSQALRKITGLSAKAKTTIIFINQFRSKINMYGGGGKTTTGGNALKFYASQRVELYRGNKPIMKDGEPIGIQVEATVIKNKIAPPFQKASLFVRWGQGVDTYIDILRVAVEKEIIEKKKSWYVYKDNKVQGEDGMAEFIRDNNLYDEIYTALQELGI